MGFLGVGVALGWWALCKHAAQKIIRDHGVSWVGSLEGLSYPKITYYSELT